MRTDEFEQLAREHGYDGCPSGLRSFAELLAERDVLEKELKPELPPMNLQLKEGADGMYYLKANDWYLLALYPDGLIVRCENAARADDPGRHPFREDPDTDGKVKIT